MSAGTVITFGTFDVFHVGHIRVLQRAAELGDRLVVGVSADARTPSVSTTGIIEHIASLGS